MASSASRGGTFSPTRLAYEWLIGPIPEGMELDHLCRVPACIRPDHLEPVTHLENVRRGNAVKTHCKHGHEFTPETTRYHASNGGRYCGICRDVSNRRNNERRRLEKVLAKEKTDP